MSFQQPDDARFMRRAIELACRNPRAPFAAVIVRRKDGTVLAEGVNRADQSPIWHGEIVAIDQWAMTFPKADASGLCLYTTAEPCPMCQAAILWTGIPRVVFGTSIGRLAELGWQQIGLSAEEIARHWPFTSCEIRGGVMAPECDALFEAAMRMR